MSPAVAPAQRRRRVGGRSDRVRRAVGHAAQEILAEGRTSFTVVEVAERAGVSRRTVYRWWPTQAALLGEALDQHVRTVEVPDTGSWAADLRAFAHRVAEFAGGPVDVAMARVIASGQQPDFAEAVLRQYEPVLTAWHAMLGRAIARGQASDRHRPETVTHTLLAPLFLAPLMTGAPPTPAAVDQLVDLVLDATRPDAGRAPVDEVRKPAAAREQPARAAQPG